MEKQIDPVHLDIACMGILTANESLKVLYDKIKAMQPKVLAACPETEERVKGLLLGIVLAGMDGLSAIDQLKERNNPEMELKMAATLAVGLFGESPSMEAVRNFMTQFSK